VILHRYIHRMTDQLWMAVLWPTFPANHRKADHPLGAQAEISISAGCRGVTVFRAREMVRED